MLRKKTRVVFTDRSIDSVNSFLREISHFKPLTTEEEYKLWSLIQQGDEKAGEQLVLANLRYAVMVAKDYLRSNAPFEDLIQAGGEGLIKAVKTYDASRGYRFITYATWFVENEVRKFAKDYCLHNSESLDKPAFVDEEDGPTDMDNVYAWSNQSADWNLRYQDALFELKNRAEKRQCGFYALTADLHQMLIDGYSIADFARKNHLNKKQMAHFLAILREEAGVLHTEAA